MYGSEIDRIEFYILGTNDNKLLSNVSIQNKELFKGTLPYPEGVYDAHMGTTDNSWNCQTCYNKKQSCPGHPGSLNLKYPVQNPLCAKEILKWLRITCFNCGEFVTSPSKIPKVGLSKVLNEFSKVVYKALSCHNCGTVHPIVSRDKQDDRIILLEDYGVDKKPIGEPRRIYNHTIKSILNKIPDRNVILMGKTPLCHPVKYLLETIRVPANTIRPDVKRAGGSRSSNDDITTAIKKMVEGNELLPDLIPAIIDKTLAAKLTNMDYIYYAMIKGTSVASQKNKIVSDTGSFSSIASRMPRKEGRIRSHLMGKRVRYMMRSVITCDNSLAIDEIGVPISIAKDLQIKEVVQEYNKKIMMKFYLNGTATYPGCSKVIKKRTGETMDINNVPKDFNLEIGDQIMRDLIDGDVMDFNRQPSLWFASIACHKIRVLETGDTLRMNVSACVLYNADFDGDCMNGIVPSSIMSRFEIEHIAGFTRWFLSYQDSAPVIGVYQDGLVGISELTRSDIKMDRMHFMRHLNFSTENAPDLLEKVLPKEKSLSSKLEIASLFSGRDIISCVLPKINFNKVPNIYQEGHSPYVKYDKDEIKVSIVDGHLLSGVLDKKSVGQKAESGMFKAIALEYGSRKALDIIYQLQQIATTFLFNRGFTVSVEDFTITDSAQQEIQEVQSEMIAQSKLITEKLNQGKIIPPIGSTTEDTYEAMQMNALSSRDELLAPVLKCLGLNNGLYKLISIGSKGSFENFKSISAAISQLRIDDNRMKFQFGYRRTLPYFPRFDTSPSSRGFIASSFKKGLNVTEFIFGAMECRTQLINNALKTSVTGEESRKSIKNMESTVVDNFRSSKKETGIIQILYGEDGIDPRKLEQVKINSVMMDDKTFEDTFKNTFRNSLKGQTSLEESLNAEYNQLLFDRKLYREMYLLQEKMTISNDSAYSLFSATVWLPVNFQRIIENVTNLTQTKSEEKLTSKEVKEKQNQNISETKPQQNATFEKSNLLIFLEKINKFTETIKYVYLNEYQEKINGYVPEYITHSLTLFNIAFRSYFNTANLLKLNVTVPELEVMLSRIKLALRQSLIDYGTNVGIIAAQSLSAPFMQSVLDSKHKAGLSGKKTKGVKRYKEITGAKPTEKMISPSMVLFVPSIHESDETYCTIVANHIEMLPMKRFVASYQCFFEDYKNIIHPLYVHENKLIDQYHKYNPSVKPPSDITKWCLRYELYRNEMLLKNMKLETIISKLSSFKTIYWIHSPENADVIVIRGYIRSSRIKKTLNQDFMEDLNNEILGTVIRGIDGILSANVELKLRSFIDSDGSIKSSKNTYIITTDGTNVSKMMENQYIDVYNIQTDSIKEIAHMYGIEAARLKIASELKDIISNQAHRHYISYADEMTYTGSVTSIERSGLNLREPNSSLLRMATGAPVEIIQNVGINNMIDKIHGVSGPLMVGRVPYYGTLYNSYHVNEEFVTTNTKSIEDVLSTL